VLFTHGGYFYPCQNHYLKADALQFECQQCQIFLILVEIVKNCNHIHAPDRDPSIKQWLVDFTRITCLMKIMKILIMSG
jgi:hypothetical protein